MATAPVGRIIYTRQAMPAVELVNFALDAGDVVIRTASAGKLAAAIRGTVVAFEADQYDPSTHEGWSVTVVGLAGEVTDAERAKRLRIEGPHPWAPGDQPYLMTITPGIVNGRYLSAAGSGPAGPPDEGLPLRVL